MCCTSVRLPAADPCRARGPALWCWCRSFGSGRRSWLMRSESLGVQLNLSIIIELCSEKWSPSIHFISWGPQPHMSSQFHLEGESARISLSWNSWSTSYAIRSSSYIVSALPSHPFPPSALSSLWLYIDPFSPGHIFISNHFLTLNEEPWFVSYPATFQYWCISPNSAFIWRVLVWTPSANIGLYRRRQLVYAWAFLGSIVIPSSSREVSYELPDIALAQLLFPFHR